MSGKGITKYPTTRETRRYTVCEMFVLKNRNEPDLSEAISEARLSHSKQLLKKLECRPMPNVMVAMPNIGGALCSTPQSLADAHYYMPCSNAAKTRKPLK